MPTATRIFRVFVSSTFEDLKAERDALAAPGSTFDHLANLCRSLDARFQPIDLRWGVREEAGHDQRTMEICLREVERCQRTGVKPNFVILLGNRYGWRPLPARIPVAEFRMLDQAIENTLDRALIGDWYKLDTNATPAEYLLKPRTDEYVDKHLWEEKEAQLHAILRTAARVAGLSSGEQIKYIASATHQEIIKGIGQTAAEREHVFAFLRATEKRDTDP